MQREYFGPPADWTEWQEKLLEIYQQVPVVSEISLDDAPDGRDLTVLEAVMAQSAWERIQTDPRNRTVEVPIGRFDLALLDGAPASDAAPLPAPPGDDEEWI